MWLIYLYKNIFPFLLYILRTFLCFKCLYKMWFCFDAVYGLKVTVVMCVSSDCVRCANKIRESKRMLLTPSCICLQLFQAHCRQGYEVGWYFISNVFCCERDWDLCSALSINLFYIELPGLGKFESGQVRN